jgi:hypothetical protein
MGDVRDTPNHIKFMSSSAPASIWTTPINESAELTQWPERMLCLRLCIHEVPTSHWSQWYTLNRMETSMAMGCFWPFINFALNVAYIEYVLSPSLRWTINHRQNNNNNKNITIITIRTIRNISKTITFSFISCPSKKTNSYFVSLFILPVK